MDYLILEMKVRYNLIWRLSTDVGERSVIAAAIAEFTTGPHVVTSCGAYRPPSALTL
jgi:hypothetical protein